MREGQAAEASAGGEKQIAAGKTGRI